MITYFNDYKSKIIWFIILLSIIICVVCPLIIIDRYIKIKFEPHSPEENLYKKLAYVEFYEGKNYEPKKFIKKLHKLFKFNDEDTLSTETCNEYFYYIQGIITELEKNITEDKKTRNYKFAKNIRDVQFPAIKGIYYGINVTLIIIAFILIIAILKKYITELIG